MAEAPTPPETIGQRLRRLRTERKLSQRELASKGVSYAYISRIEAGTRQPSVKALRMLARKLGVSTDYLETGSEIGDAQARELRLADAELELRLSDEQGTAAAVVADVLDEAIQSGDTSAAVRARCALGMVASSAGRHGEAIRCLEQALEPGLLTPILRPDVYITLGRSYASSGEPRRAVELFDACLDEIEHADGDTSAIRTRFATYLSYALTDAGDLERAETVLADALDGADEATDPYTRVRLYWSLARLASLQGRSAAALDHARKAVALLEATEDTLHLARAHLLCAAILNLNGDADRAVRHLGVAENLFGPKADSDDMASLRSEQARSAAQLGRGDEAVEMARLALELLADADPGEQGNATWALAEGLALRGEDDDASEAFGRAIDLLEDNGRWREASQAARAWSKLLRRTGRETEAIDILERAADLAGRRTSAAASTRP